MDKVEAVIVDRVFESAKVVENAAKELFANALMFADNWLKGLSGEEFFLAMSNDEIRVMESIIILQKHKDAYIVFLREQEAEKPENKVIQFPVVK